MSQSAIHVRAIEPRDLDPLLALYTACFPGTVGRPRDEVRRKLGQLFVDGPLCDAAMPSLCACDESGALVGFRGRMRRWWRSESEPLFGATTTHMMVRADLRRAGVGKLLRAAAHTDEDRSGRRMGVSFSDRSTADGRAYSAGNDRLVRLEQFGFDWSAPVRRLGLAAARVRSALGRRLPAGALRRAAHGLAALGSRALPEVPSLEGRALRSAPLSPGALQEALAAAGEGRALRLDEPPEVCAWLLDYLRDYASRGRCIDRVWLDERGSPIGFYVAYRNAAEGFELLGFAVRAELEEEARRQVLRDARAEGALYANGTACARELRTLLALGARVEAGARASVRSQTSGVVERFQAMDVLLTGLEGERWL